MTANKGKLPELLDNLQLPAYTCPGGYPLFYLDGHDSTLCPKCATECLSNDTPSLRPVACAVHWEGEPLSCEECNADIESAYGDPDPIDLGALSKLSEGA